MIPTTQKCLQWVRTGEHPFQYTESAPVTQSKDLKNNEILIQVHACGLNPFDIKMAETNFFKIPLPSAVGYDISGKIVAVGSKVTNFQVGDEVFGCSSQKAGGGGYQQYCVVSEDAGFIKKPAAVSHEQAGSLGIAFLTALDGLQHVKDQMKGKSVFIPGASGGVGHFAAQICKIWGAYPLIVSASKDEGIKLLKDMYQCDYVINHSNEDIVKKVKEFTEDRGADIVYDTTYLSSSYEKSIQCTADDGTWIVLANERVSEEQKQMIQQCKVKSIRADLGKYSLDPEYELKQRKQFFENGLKLAADWIVSGQLKPYVNQIITLEQVEETLQKVKKKQTGFGKIVAKIHEDSK